MRGLRNGGDRLDTAGTEGWLSLGGFGGGVRGTAAGRRMVAAGRKTMDFGGKLLYAWYLQTFGGWEK